MEKGRGLPHASSLHNRNQDVDVVKLDSAADTIARFHLSPHRHFAMTGWQNSITGA